MPKKILDELLERYPELEYLREDISKAFSLICNAFESGGKLLVCGNGGSAADADHIVGELMKGFLLKRPLPVNEKEKLRAAGDATGIGDHLQIGLPAINLCAQSGLMTAFINDCNADDVFAQQVYAYARNSLDILLGLSTSGNSRNVVNAVITARAIGIPSVAITGKKESKLSSLATVCLRLPSDETFKVQEYTLPVYHCLCAMVEQYFFG